MATKYKAVTSRLPLLVAALAVQANCGGSEEKVDFTKTKDYTPYQSTPGESVVVTGEANYVGPTEQIPEKGEFTVGGETGTGEAIDTSTVQGKFCSDPGAKMDVITVDGKLVDVICYPPPTPENTTVVENNKQSITDVQQNANGTVLVFEPDTDGKSIVGDVTVDANNVAIYGNGPDKTVIDGNLTIDGNNARVRGVRVTGNVILDLNNVALLFSVVEGNVEVRKNNVTVAATDVFGDLTVIGNNAVLVQNRVQGKWDIQGSEEYCDGNSSFKDADGDFVVSQDEIVNQLTCKSKAAP